MVERVEGRVVVPSEAVKRERLSDVEMGNLISALGNHEAKALTLCLMTQGIIYSARDLHRTTIQAQGENIGWRINRRVPFQYCQQSLSPIGLVTHEVINPNLSTYGYVKTEYGERVGVPLAGLLLDFSLRHPDFSLRDFLSLTSSKSPSQEMGEMDFKKRAPITRIKIFWEILTASLPIRTVDIARRIREFKPVVGGHLSELGERGLILYEAIRFRYGNSYVYYRLSEAPPSSEPESYQGQKTLTSFVYRLLREDGNREWSAEAITRQYLRLLEENDRPLPEERSLEKRISRVLSYLTRQWYARRRNFISKEIRSRVTLTEEQRRRLLDFVSLLDRFQNQEPAVLEFGRRRANAIVVNPQELSLLLAKAREHSSYANKRPRQETTDDILRLISSRPDCTTEQIREALREEGRRLSTNRICALIGPLIINRKITQTTVGGVKHLNLANNPQ